MIPAAMIPCPRRDHLNIVQLHREEAAQSPSDGNADVEQPGKARRRFSGNGLEQREIAAGPQAGCLFQCTVAEEAHHNLFGARDPYDFFH